MYAKVAQTRSAQLGSRLRDKCSARLTVWLLLCQIERGCPHPLAIRANFTSQQAQGATAVRSGLTRQQTAQDLLDVVAGRPLANKHWGAQLQRSLLALDHVPLPPIDWIKLGLTSCQINAYLAALFLVIPAAVRAAGLPMVELSRFDLFHGHLFLARSTLELGILFHAKEYPAYDPVTFPINLGFCQRDSDLRFQERAMDLRNLLLYQGKLNVLDVGAQSVLHDTLLMYGLQPVRTVLESDFGEHVVDINYFVSVNSTNGLYVC